MGSKYFSEKRISIYAVIISIISIVITSMFSLRQCKLETRLNKLHIDPKIEYYLVRSIDEKSLEFYLKNKSPIPVVNLSVAHKLFLYSDNSKKYVMERPAVSSILDSPGQNWIFKQKLDPNESIGKKEYQILDLSKFYEGKTKIVIVAIFEITFYRESDMKRFSNKAIFFLDNEKIYSYMNALDQDHLKEPIKQLSAFEIKMFDIRKDSESRDNGSRLYQKAD